MKYHRLALTVVVTGMISGWLLADATNIPNKGIQKFELLSLSPDLQVEGKPSGLSANSKTKLFHSYPILGSLEVKRAEDIRKIIEAVNADFRPHMQNMCLFFPRHGLRIFYKGSIVEYLICYQCGDVAKYDETHAEAPLSLSIGKSSKELLNRYLSEAKVPLAPDVDQK